MSKETKQDVFYEAVEDDGMLAGIICCQWCGRKLEA